MVINEEYYMGVFIEEFCKEFITSIAEIKDTLNKLGVKDDVDNLPKPFNNSCKVEIDSYYSSDKKLIFLNFRSSNDLAFRYTIVQGNPIPFELFDFQYEPDKDGFSIIRNGTLIKGKISYEIGFGYIMSLKTFVDKFNNTKEFAQDFINSYRDLNMYKNKYDRIAYTIYLKRVKEEFSKLISDENTPELVIDKFLEDHEVVLQRGLHLDKFMHQVVMKNLLGKYEHDLKPDLIAYDTLNKKWTIIDYKKSKRSIIKNMGKVRTGLRAEVYDLENQLRDYVEYFNEIDHRNYIKEVYDVKISFPDSIGIIGNVASEEQETFNRVRMDLPRWFNVMPYNYLYDSFCSYVDLIEKILKNRSKS